MKPSKNILGTNISRLGNRFRKIPGAYLVIGIIGTFGANSATQVLGVLGGILMARALGPEGRGQVAAVLVSAQFLSWAINCGLGWGNWYYLSKQPEAASVILTNSLLFALLISAPALAIGGYLIVHLFADYPPEVRLAAAGFFALTPLSIASVYMILAQQALHQFRWFNGIRAGRQAIQLVGIMTLFVAHKLTATSAIATVGVANLVSGILALVWFGRHHWRGLVFDRAMLGKCFSFGLKSYFAIMAQTGVQRIDQLVIVPLVSSSDLGLYTVSASLSEGVGTIPDSIATVLSPKVARVDRSAGKDFLSKTLLCSGFLVAILICVLIMTANIILKLLYGDAFIPATQVFQILLVASWFLSMGDMLVQGLRGLGRPLPGTWGEASALIVNVILLLLLVPSFGITGAAVSSLAAYFVRFLISLLLVVTTSVSEDTSGRLGEASRGEGL